ncbi:phosphatase PAP2 family protein [Tenacibaculum maritimum]|uniref:PA-phosphatase-like phosphoesterase n=1 Tax=Tenacibaculum maritimum NCIMB 2154 TaxID=1349785 RepID=A0A2H1EE80_9FLAO|nr:phosphatase PAP2 family protein [Tenacibaculum maritimum]QCD63362.1 phosphatase PAP2 family protein [Tenacibaculum maritimum]SFZ85160.1 PA-phosphatase-like phosphoesterase [Tenacibaculum maritimum NCIMB 2154]
MLEELIQYDYRIIIFLNSLGAKKWDAFWIFITEPTHWYWLFMLTTLLFFKFFGIKRGTLLILNTILTCVVTLILVELIKQNVARLRPINNHEIKHSLRFIKNAENFSFVSGHAAFSFTFSFLVFKILKEKIKFSWVLFLFPLLFAYSRLYLGVHFLSDILSGLFLGFLIANIGWIVSKKWILNQVKT